MTEGAGIQVAITGVGVVSPLGWTWPDFRDRVLTGQSAIRRREFNFGDIMTTSAPAALVEGFEPEVDLPNSKASSLDRVSVFAVYSARKALAMSGISGDQVDEICIGACTGGMESIEAGYLRMASGDDRLSPMTIPKFMSNSPASAVSIDLGCHAPSYCVSSACSSSNQAIIGAVQRIASGQRSVVLTGGTEASATIGPVLAWKRLRVMSDETCRPFCRTRSGMVLGEGAAMFILEALDHAKTRGAKPLAIVTGLAENSDAGSMTGPDQASITAAIGNALASAGLVPGEIDYVNAHGTGTRVNDKCEAEAINAVFGRDGTRPVVSSTKALHGHLLGASGAIELAACIAAIETGIAPPQGNFQEADPEIDIAIAGQAPPNRDVWHVLSSSFAFGGHNAVLVLSHP